ncbi:hypothetical protein FKOIJHOC_00120 [Acinetobacter phage Ab_121]|nr:hypothetical protein FKOIJHOC_00120 [Acinetobacter phage Ab_121]QQV88794.1 hypothetical protein Liucustia_94 [Acinetobacter phage Liucustia]
MSECKDVCNFSYTNNKNIVVEVILRTDGEAYWIMEGPRYVGEFEDLETIENYFFQNYNIAVDLSKFK